jgi:hypothetical protein
MTTDSVLVQQLFPGWFTSLPAVASQARQGVPRWVVTIRHIATSGISFQLRHPLDVTVSWEDNNAWSCEAKDLSILSFGDTRDSALESFAEDFHALWDVIGQSPDELLDPSAVRVKQLLRNLVDSVPRG